MLRLLLVLGAAHVDAGCDDDETWFWKKSANDCSWLASGEAESGRCEKTNDDGVSGLTACGAACFQAVCAARGENDACGACNAVIAAAGDACPDGFAAIASRGVCLAAAAELSLGGWDFAEEDEADWPSGCYFCDGVGGCSDGLWYNEHATGRAVSGTRTACASDAWAPAVHTLFLGDSDMDNWQTSARYPNSANVAVGGYTCKDVRDEIDGLLADFGSPATVSLVCGENDMASGKSAAEAFARMTAVVDKVAAAGGRVVAWGCKPEPSMRSLHGDYEAYDALLRGLATERGGAFAFVDVYPAFESLGNPDSLYASDELHLSAEGYALWNAWSDAALGDASCVRWLSGECAEYAPS